MATIGVCTSARPSNVEALIEKLRSQTGVAVVLVQLPYNDLDSYRLDQSRRKLNGIILCHSINNRRFAITNVLDALYDKFLPYAARVFGKENVCVIVHDFPWPMLPSTTYSSQPVDVSKIVEIHARIKATHMESFRSRQYTTFECCSLAMLCGRLDSQVNMDEADWTELQEWFISKYHTKRSKDQPDLGWLYYAVPGALALAAGFGRNLLLSSCKIVSEASVIQWFASILCAESLYG